MHEYGDEGGFAYVRWVGGRLRGWATRFIFYFFYLYLSII